ncbi:MAG: hypothetical protein VX498_01210 [Myxococcota bacterium]|nr:hypothetical protein [Myxococcota bacterium]
MNERESEIILWYSDQVRAGGLPEGRERFLALIEEAGFTEQEFREALKAAETQALGREAEASPSPAVEEPRPLAVAQLSDEATRFLNSLRALGYLDDLMEDEVLDLLMAELPAGSSVHDLPNIELDDLRSHVATVLFDRLTDLDPETQRLLQEEWRLAFH